MVAVECSKVVVVIINIIFMIFGLAALVAGIVFKVGWDKVRDVFDFPDLDDDIKFAGDALAYGAIVFGAFILILALLGCIGACCKVRVLLAVYAIVVIILLIAQVAIVIVVVIKGKNVEDALKKELKKTLEKYNEDSQKESNAWSALFNTLECCGVNNITDFEEYKTAANEYKFYASVRPDGKRKPEYRVPITCCKSWDYTNTLKDTSFTDDLCLKGESGKYYNQGCVDSVVDKIDSNKAILIGVGVAIFVIELLVAFLAFCICCSKHGKDVAV